MSNKYLEKVAKMSEEEVKRHGNNAAWKSLAGGALVPYAGNVAGYAHELHGLKKKISGKDPEFGGVAKDSLKSFGRSFGRSALEGGAGAGVGAMLAGAAGLALKSRNPSALYAIGAGAGGVLGGLHGHFASSRNSIRDRIHQYEAEAEKS